MNASATIGCKASKATVLTIILAILLTFPATFFSSWNTFLSRSPTLVCSSRHQNPVRFTKCLILYPPSGLVSLVLTSAMFLSVGICAILKSFLFWVHNHVLSKRFIFQFLSSLQIGARSMSLWKCNGPTLFQEQIPELLKKLLRATLLHMKISWSSVTCFCWTMDNCSMHGALLMLTFFCATPIWVWQCLRAPLALAFLHITFLPMETQVLDNSQQPSSNILGTSSSDETTFFKHPRVGHSWSQFLHCECYIIPLLI